MITVNIYVVYKCIRYGDDWIKFKNNLRVSVTSARGDCGVQTARVTTRHAGFNTGTVQRTQQMCTRSAILLRHYTGHHTHTHTHTICGVTFAVIAIWRVVKVFSA